MSQQEYQQYMADQYKNLPAPALDYKQMIRRYLGGIIEDNPKEVREALIELAQELEGRP